MALPLGPQIDAAAAQELGAQLCSAAESADHAALAQLLATCRWLLGPT